jgi:hypothetical protein
MANLNKILISGTGRCGTTFLIKLFTFMGFDTGFDSTNYQEFIYSNCNAGMEKHYTDPHLVLKWPRFLDHIPDILEHCTIQYMIIPVRKYEDSAASRAKHGNGPGGFRDATSVETQITHYHKVIAEYIYYMTKYDIPTIFLDFERMVTDKHYLYQKLRELFDQYHKSFDVFAQAYDASSETSKPNICVE